MTHHGTPPGPYSHLDRPPLDGAALRAALVVDGSMWTDIVVTHTTASTNADASVAARDGAAEGTVFTTHAQTSGRGRLDRSWDSAPGSGLAVSVVLRPDVVPPARWVWLPLLVGLAVDATVHDLGVDSGVKWPNDVLVEDRKIAGILLERVETPLGAAAVVGIGLNVSMAPRGAAGAAGDVAGAGGSDVHGPDGGVAVVVAQSGGVVQSLDRL